MILLQLERSFWNKYIFYIEDFHEYKKAKKRDEVGDWFKYRYNAIKKL